MLAQEIIAVNIFVHSCGTSIVRTICLSLSLLFFFSCILSLSVLFSFFCVLFLCFYTSTYTENKTKSNETIIFSSFFLSLSLSLFSLFNQSTSTLIIFLEFTLPLGYKSRCLPIQSSFPFSNSLHPGQDRTLPLTLFSFNDISFFFFCLDQSSHDYILVRLRFRVGQIKSKECLNSKSSQT